MTKEELEKEAGDYAEKHSFRVPYDGSNKFYDDVDFKASKEDYLAGAKPREKQIAKLEDTLEKLEDERIQLIAKLAFTENALNNCKAKIEKAVDLITKLSQLEHRADDCFTYNEYLELIKEAKQFLNNEENKMEEKSNNLRFENDEPPVSPSSVETNDVIGYIHCDDENLNNEQLSWTPYYSYDDELRNNLKSVIASDMNIDEKVNIIIALCSQTIAQVPNENTNPYNPSQVWYNSKPEYCTNAKCTDATKPNPYMPYEYCSTQLKSDTENNNLVHVLVGGTISAELYNIIKDKLENGIEYHECDGTRINKKEYETLYNAIGHAYDWIDEYNVEAPDFQLPNMKGWYIRIK